MPKQQCFSMIEHFLVSLDCTKSMTSSICLSLGLMTVILRETVG